MSSKMPPVPPANVSPKGPAPAERPPERPGDPGREAAGVQAPVAGKVGQAANTRINTTNQGLQQDR